MDYVRIRSDYICITMDAPPPVSVVAAGCVTSLGRYAKEKPDQEKNHPGAENSITP
jgi:hypothetical protein